MQPELLPNLQLRIAAHARRGQTQYRDDQTWALSLGQGAEPALSLQSSFGGRVGLARLVPLIRLQNRSVYEQQAFAGRAQLTLLLPDALRLKILVQPGLTLHLLYWTPSSRLLCGHFHFVNSGDSPLPLDAQLYLQVMSRQEKLLPAPELVLDLPDGSSDTALGVEGLEALSPVLTMTGASALGEDKLSSSLTVPAGGEASLRFSHAALPSLAESAQAAYQHLRDDWAADLEALEEAWAAQPQLQTGDDLLDAAIVLSQQTALQSVIAATDSLPFPSPIFTRSPGHGSTEARGWEGQSALDTFQLALNLLPLDASFATDFVHNYLAVQAADGFIDAAPGAAGQRSGALLPPLLATLVQQIHQHSQDSAFVQELYPRLLRFYRRWFAQDADSDGYPEWGTLTQAYQNNHPLFASFRLAPPDLQFVETPDLAAYLLREGEALAALAEVAGQQSAWAAAAPLHQGLMDALQESWQAAEQRFIYRDRDSHQPLIGREISSGKGEGQRPLQVSLTPPQRLLVEVESGPDRHPNVDITLQGQNAAGQPSQEHLDAEAFTWYRRRGVALTSTLWSALSRLEVEGLSRVYSYTLRSQDLSLPDFTQLLPYIADSLPPAQHEALLDRLQQDYFGAFGPATLPLDAPEEAGRRVVLPWATLLGLTLLRRGQTALSAELFLQVAQAQVNSLVQQGHFYEWYHVESGLGLGLVDHATGIVPLGWLWALLGFSVQDAHSVRINGPCAFPRDVTLTQHGLSVTRSPVATRIRFPDGQQVDLPPDAPPQLVQAAKAG